jgi:uncharacterized protein (TIGR02145 family)
MLLDIVKQIVTKYGDQVLSDSKRIQAFFLDLAKDEPKPIKRAFIECLDHGVVKILKDVDEKERANCKETIAQRLCTEEGLEVKQYRQAIDILCEVLFGCVPNLTTEKYNKTVDLYDDRRYIVDDIKFDGGKVKKSTSQFDGILLMGSFIGGAIAAYLINVLKIILGGWDLVVELVGILCVGVLYIMCLIIRWINNQKKLPTWIGVLPFVGMLAVWIIGYLYNEKAEAHFDKSEYSLAIKDYNLSEKLYSTNSLGLYHARGTAYYNKGDYDLAIKDYTKAIRKKPTDVVAYTSRGDAYYGKGDYALAIADYEAALRIDSSYERAKKGIELVRESSGMPQNNNGVPGVPIDANTKTNEIQDSILLNRIGWENVKKNGNEMNAKSPPLINGSVSYFTDTRDSKTYKTVSIGGKTWMAENLSYKMSGGSWCYDNNDSNCNKYGRLYTWDAAKAICPLGWHLPTRREWGDLAIFAGGTGDYGKESTAGTKLKAKSGWNNKDNGSSGNGTDYYEFSALPGGSRHYGDNFYFAGVNGTWWTATEMKIGSINAYVRNMYYSSDNVSEFYSEKKGMGYSVRCLKDGTPIR